MVNCPICDQPNSRGYRWREVNNIQVVHMSRRPGNVRVNEEEERSANYSRNLFSEHLEIKRDCIYHKLTWVVDEMERTLRNRYGTRVTLYFKQNNTSHKTMHELICRESRTVTNLLMVCRLQVCDRG